jgi:hypothetical protein
LISSYQASPANVDRSLAAWIYGTDAAAYPASGATILDVDGTPKTFAQIYTKSLPPFLGGVPDTSEDLNARLAQGSPLLCFYGRSEVGTKPFQGDFGGIVTVRITLSCFCAVWLDQASGTLDRGASLRQLMNAVDRLGRIFEVASGAFPIYNYSLTPAQANQLGIGEITDAKNPAIRTDVCRADWSLYCKYMRSADTVASAGM